jgi:hypothetical protein
MNAINAITEIYETIVSPINDLFETGDRGFSHSVKVVPDTFYIG